MIMSTVREISQDVVSRGIHCLKVWPGGSVTIMYALYASIDRNVVNGSPLIVILRRMVARVSMYESERVLGRAVQGATEEERRGQQRSGRDRVNPFWVLRFVPWCGMRSSSVRGAGSVRRLCGKGHLCLFDSVETGRPFRPLIRPDCEDPRGLRRERGSLSP